MGAGLCSGKGTAGQGLESRLPLSGLVTLGKILIFSEPQFLYQFNEGNNTYLTEWWINFLGLPQQVTTNRVA